MPEPHKKFMRLRKPGTLIANPPDSTVVLLSRDAVLFLALQHKYNPVAILVGTVGHILPSHLQIFGEGALPRIISRICRLIKSVNICIPLAPTPPSPPFRQASRREVWPPYKYYIAGCSQIKSLTNYIAHKLHRSQIFPTIIQPVVLG
jgi:hypothetical protein